MKSAVQIRSPGARRSASGGDAFDLPERRCRSAKSFQSSCRNYRKRPYASSQPESARRL